MEEKSNSRLPSDVTSRRLESRAAAMNQSKVTPIGGINLGAKIQFTLARSQKLSASMASERIETLDLFKFRSLLLRSSERVRE